MIAKYLFFLILFIVMLIHALQPRPRLSAAAPSKSERGHGTGLCSWCAWLFLHVQVSAFIWGMSHVFLYLQSDIS